MNAWKRYISEPSKFDSIESSAYVAALLEELLRLLNVRGRRRRNARSSVELIDFLGELDQQMIRYAIDSLRLPQIPDLVLPSRKWRTDSRGESLNARIFSDSELNERNQHNSQPTANRLLLPFRLRLCDGRSSEAQLCGCNLDWARSRSDSRVGSETPSGISPIATLATTGHTVTRPHFSRLITLKEAAHQSGYSVSGLRKIVNRTKEGRPGPQIEFHQVKRGRIKFRQEAVDRFINTHTVTPGQIVRNEAKRVGKVSPLVETHWCLAG